MINLHTHTYRCGHATGTDREYIEAAIQNGYKEFGFADHSPIDFYAMFSGNPSLEKEAVFSYAEDLRALRKEYEKDALIHIGFETEFYTDIFEDNIKTFREAGIEYIILGQHYCFNAEGRYTPSGRPTDDPVCLDNYLKLLRGGISTGLFTYIAHPDLVRFTGPDEVYLQKIVPFLEEVKAAGVVLEYNFVGFKQKRNYPDPRFWRAVADLKIPTVIGLDAHEPEAYGELDKLAQLRESLASFGIEPIDPVVKPL